MPIDKLTFNKIAWNTVSVSSSLTEILVYDVIANKQSYNYWTEEKGTEVTPTTFKEALDKITTNEICVRINSGGGDVFAAEAIRTAIMEKRTDGKKVTCKIDGFCGSAAVGIAEACEWTGISSSAYFMIHDPSVFVYGYYNANDFGKVASMLKKIKQGIINAYAKKTGKSKTEISDLMTQETWYTGDEAVENGFCDELMFEELDNSHSQNIENAVDCTNVENSIYAENIMGLSVMMYKKIPKELINRSQLTGSSQNKKDSGLSNINRLKKESAKQMDIKTIDDLKASYPELINQIINDVTAKERERIKDIEDIAVDGYEAIVNSAKFESPINAGEVAMRIISEQKKQGINYLDNRQKDINDSNVNNVANGANADLFGQDGTDVFDKAIDKLYPSTK